MWKAPLTQWKFLWPDRVTEIEVSQNINRGSACLKMISPFPVLMLLFRKRAWPLYRVELGLLSFSPPRSSRLPRTRRLQQQCNNHRMRSFGKSSRTKTVVRDEQELWEGIVQGLKRWRATQVTSAEERNRRKCEAKFNSFCSPHSSSFSPVEQEMGITVVFHQIHVIDRKAKFLLWEFVLFPFLLTKFLKKCWTEGGGEESWHHNTHFLKISTVF